jgi:hypothetical protein
MSVSPHIPSDRDLELLSAYLDGELSDREKEQLEQRLARESALRADLDDLRETVALLSGLPRLKAPRSFTLDPAVYGRPMPWWQRIFTLKSALQLSGALGAAASMLLIILAVALTQRGSGQSSRSAENSASGSSQVAMQSTLAEAQAEETALAYAGNDLLQTTMAAQSLYYATHQPTPTPPPTQAALSMAAPAGEETYQDTTAAPTEEAQEMAADAVAPAESEAPVAPGNEEPSTLMVQPGMAQPPGAPNAVGGAAAPPPAAAAAPTATPEQPLVAPQPVAPPSEVSSENQRDENAAEGNATGANAAVSPPTSAAEAMLLATATPAPATQAEKTRPNETAVFRGQPSSEESASYWWLAGIGLVTLAASVALFVWGSRRTRA